jgi:transposase InsO family protein
MASSTSRAYWVHGVKVLMICAFEHAACDDSDICNDSGPELQISTDWPLHHSDRGVPYMCRELLEEHGMAQSLSRASNCSTTP